jgi:integrase/recombinase XerD
LGTRAAWLTLFPLIAVLRCFLHGWLKIRQRGKHLKETFWAIAGPWVRRFLLECLIGERNLARNTQRSYRDTLRLLLPSVAGQVRIAIDRLRVEDLTADRVRAFLQAIEEERGCGVATRNQRLAAIHSLAHFIALHSPEHVAWCGQIRAVPLKRAPRPLVGYLEKKEMEALLAAPDQGSRQGLRD